MLLALGLGAVISSGAFAQDTTVRGSNAVSVSESGAASVSDSWFEQASSVGFPTRMMAGVNRADVLQEVERSLGESAFGDRAEDENLMTEIKQALALRDHALDSGLGDPSFEGVCSAVAKRLRAGDRIFSEADVSDAAIALSLAAGAMEAGEWVSSARSIGLAPDGDRVNELTARGLASLAGTSAWAELDGASEAIKRVLPEALRSLDAGALGAYSRRDIVRIQEVVEGLELDASDYYELVGRWVESGAWKSESIPALTVARRETAQGAFRVLGDLRSLRMMDREIARIMMEAPETLEAMTFKEVCLASDCAVMYLPTAGKKRLRAYILESLKQKPSEVCRLAGDTDSEGIYNALGELLWLSGTTVSAEQVIQDRENLFAGLVTAFKSEGVMPSAAELVSLGELLRSPLDGMSSDKTDEQEKELLGLYRSAMTSDSTWWVEADLNGLGMIRTWMGGENPVVGRRTSEEDGGLTGAQKLQIVQQALDRLAADPQVYTGNSWALRQIGGLITREEDIERLDEIALGGDSLHLGAMMLRPWVMYKADGGEEVFTAWKARLDEMLQSGGYRGDSLAVLHFAMSMCDLRLNSDIETVRLPARAEAINHAESDWMRLAMVVASGYEAYKLSWGYSSSVEWLKQHAPSAQDPAFVMGLFWFKQLAQKDQFRKMQQETFVVNEKLALLKQRRDKALAAGVADLIDRYDQMVKAELARLDQLQAIDAKDQ